jgi:hypothetical protein
MTTDLRELLRERAAAAPTTVEVSRLAQVHRRIGMVRLRRRVASGIAAVLLLAIAGLAFTNLHPGPLIQPAPPNPTATVDGFPVYQMGARIVATKVEHLPVTELTITYAPSTLDLVIATRCTPQDSVEVDVTVNGYPYTGGGCGSTGRINDPNGMASLGVSVGEPSQFTLAIRVNDGGDLPATGEFALAIAERMPFERYPFPPRPSALRSIDFYYGSDWAYRIESDPADPLAPRSIDVVWPDAVRADGPEVRAVSLTPGYLRLLIDGKTVWTHESWDYQADPSGLSLRDYGHHEPGDRVTLTVEPSKVTGPWAVAVFIDGP